MLPDQISAGIRTVTNTAAYFSELQQAALDMLDSFGASRRGFFTPTEDDEVRHLLVSYWQARNALIELVLAFHHDGDLSEEQRPAGFLVAYAGALVLVDAARFLREQFHDRPVVRSKLNEPEPHFAIPAGTYDTIQKSLTSPVHAWHLYHAARYFSEHEPQLRSLAANTPLDELLPLIDRLHSRIHVDAGDYAAARVRVRTRQLVDSLRRDLLWRALYGLQKAVSRLASNISTDPRHRPELPAAVRDQLLDLLQPGDVLITRKEHAFTNYFLPGYWPHAAFYLGDGEQLAALGIADHPHLAPRWRRLLDCDPAEPRRVLEALKDGVWIRSVVCPLTCDAIVVLRPRLSQPQIAEAIARGVFHEGKPYDFDFDFTRTDRLVCSEVVYRSYEGVGGLSFTLTRRAGRMTLAAEDLIRMALVRDHFEPYAVFAPTHAARLLVGDSAEAIIRRTLEHH